MQTGVISQENFSQVLRGLSQKRKHGVLEIQYADKRVDVSFVQGRIVEASLFDVNPVEDVLGMLRSAGLVRGDLESGWETSYEALFQALAARDPELGVVEEKTFARVVKHRVLDLLYCVVAKEGGYFNFKTMMVECSKHFSPSISVGQLLLDVVALQTEGEKLSQTFKEGSIIKRVSEAAAQVDDSALSEEERAIYETLSEELSLEELRLKSVLSIYHFQEALLSLNARGIVVASQAGVTSEKLLGTNFLDSLDSSIDSVFASVKDAAEEIQGLDFSENGANPGGEARIERAPSLNRSADLEEVAPNDSDLEGEELADEEEEYEDVRPGLKVRLGLVSYKLLNQTWVPHTLSVLGLVIGVIVPFLLWGEIFGAFGY